MHTLSPEDKRIFEAIRACLCPDLLTDRERKKLRPGSHRVTGHCFVATHAAYHLIGKKYGLDPHWCRVGNGGTHWWLYHPGKHEYLDPTFEQAAQPFPYHQGRRCLFYVRQHNRTNELLRRVKEYLGKGGSDGKSGLSPYWPSVR